MIGQGSRPPGCGCCASPGLDSKNLAEEIEGSARSDRRELANRSRVLLTHLLKWQY